MHEVLTDINQWQATDQGPIALATVVQTWGSAPRKVGAKMALTPDGAISGSVSGGCVEGAVFEAGVEALASGPRLLHFGVADETAWDVGLACGGTIEVFVEPLDTAVYNFLHGLIDSAGAGASVTIIRGPEELLGQKVAVSQAGETVGRLPGVLEEKAIQAAAAATHSKRLHLAEDVEVFIDVIRAAPLMVIVGGVHIAIALTGIARSLGYSTIVVDPRRAFGSQARFAHADQLIQAWPDKAFAGIDLTSSTAVVLLTHDPKIDDPALKIVLNSPAFYVGALGSSRTHAKRVERLRAMGVDDSQIGRIHAPIGLDIGADTPEEIAVAIMAEIIRASHPLISGG